MHFNLLTASVVSAVLSALSASAYSVVHHDALKAKRQTGISAELCLDPSSTGNCLVILPQENGGICIPVTEITNGNGNGISSVVLAVGMTCEMFTGPSCSGDVWTTGLSIPNFSLLSFNGNTPDNNINSVKCT